MRLIDADALIKDNGLESATKYGNRTEKQRVASYSTMMLYEIAEMIDEAPTIDADPVKHGMWKAGVTCSKCGFIRQETRSGNPVVGRYCPNCGAKMDLKDGETK